MSKFPIIESLVKTVNIALATELSLMIREYDTISKFPPTLIKEYIGLEIEAQQLVNIELPSKNHFKEVIKMEVKLVGVIPITQ